MTGWTPRGRAWLAAGAPVGEDYRRYGGHMTDKTPRELLEAVAELALAIAPHNMDKEQRTKIAAALTVLVDHIIAMGERR